MVFKSGFVALIGRPNVGKSSLLNMLLEQKIAIVSPTVQTTRNKILGVYNFRKQPLGSIDSETKKKEPEKSDTEKAGQIVFLDLPGLHKPMDKLGENCLTLSQDGAKEADILVFVTEAHKFPGKGDYWIAKWISENCKNKKLIVLLNKMDLAVKEDKFFKACAEYQAIFKEHDLQPVFRHFSTIASTKTNEYKDELLKELYKSLPEGPEYYPEEVLTNRNLRFLSTELIREQVLLLTQDEIPHSCKVEILTFEEPQILEEAETESTQKKENKKVPITKILANIIVEAESQKGILIGKKGSMIKEIGTRARKELEALIDTKVFLDLRVKVSKNWKKKQNIVDELVD